ncbi:MAG: hypothetical protein IPI38_18115 [Gemmatimonadetes bacterium]|nr:hypothetical protein [Gemmatimonadota bacterium]
MRPASLPAASLALLIACTACQSDAPSGARLEASWTATDTNLAAGKLAAGAQSAWCPVAARLEVTAVREDQGLGLALYPEQAIGPGSYPVFDPGIDTLTPRPGAAGALRWFTEQRLEAFQSDSGTVELTAAGEGFDARFGLRLVSLDRPETLRVTGTATGLVAGPCPVDAIPPTAPRTDSAAALDSATARTAVPRRRAEGRPAADELLPADTARRGAVPRAPSAQ